MRSTLYPRDPVFPGGNDTPSGKFICSSPPLEEHSHSHSQTAATAKSYLYAINVSGQPSIFMLSSSPKSPFTFHQPFLFLAEGLMRSYSSHKRRSTRVGRLPIYFPQFYLPVTLGKRGGTRCQNSVGHILGGGLGRKMWYDS